MKPLLGILLAALAAAPAAANYYQFTGTLSFPDSSPRFLPEGVGVAGSGVGFSRRLPNEIRSFGGVAGFTGPLTTGFGVTGANYTQRAFITDVGDPSFYEGPTAGGLRGALRFGGKAQRFCCGKQPNAAFPLTINHMSGLGLGGTVPASSGPTPKIYFSTWTTGTVSARLVVTESHPTKLTFKIGTITAMGYDARTVSGMGTVQFVTPIVTGPILPGAKGAVAALTLRFAPEPGRCTLLIGGSLALALLGGRRARSTHRWRSPLP